jgi:hypothetical protein
MKAEKALDTKNLEEKLGVSIQQVILQICNRLSLNRALIEP